MAIWLKRGMAADLIKSDARNVTQTVEAILQEIESRGDAAIRDFSIKFDQLDRADYRLSPEEISN